MTYERPTDPVTGEPVADDTQPVENPTYVQSDPGYVAPPAQPVVAPVQPAGSQVNVNSTTPAQPTYVETGPSGLYYARRIVSLLFGILATLLALRIVLLLLVANETNDIVNFVYNITEPFVAPFRGMFQFDAVTPGGGSVFDVAALVALIGWTLIYVLIMAILRLADRR
jgi:uncharacterized protein YggT (Ycf19 family)